MPPKRRGGFQKIGTLLSSDAVLTEESVAFFQHISAIAAGAASTTFHAVLQRKVELYHATAEYTHTKSSSNMHMDSSLVEHNVEIFL